MLTPTSPKAVTRSIIMPHGAGSVTNSRVHPQIETHQYLPEDDYQIARNLLDAEAHLEVLQHDALARQGLNLTKDAIFDKTPRARKGLKGLTRKGAHRVKASAAVIERLVGRDRSTFLTLTLPPEVLEGAETEHKPITGENWGTLVAAFNRRLKRDLERAGLEATFVQVTEVQPKRYLETGRVALHAHYLIHGKASVRGKWAISPGRYVEMWSAAIAEVTGHPLTSTPVVDVQRVKKSCANYLGKYMSKGGEIVATIIDQGQAAQLPSHWWGSTCNLKAEVERQTIRGDQDLSDWLWELCWSPDPQYFVYCYPVQVEYEEGYSLLVGFTFQLRPQFYEELRAAYLPS